MRDEGWTSPPVFIPHPSSFPIGRYSMATSSVVAALPAPNRSVHS